MAIGKIPTSGPSSRAPTSAPSVFTGAIALPTPAPTVGSFVAPGNVTTPLVNSSGVAIPQDAVVTVNGTISADSVNASAGGTLVVSQGASLVVQGTLTVQGGTLATEPQSAVSSQSLQLAPDASLVASSSSSISVQSGGVLGGALQLQITERPPATGSTLQLISSASGGLSGSFNSVNFTQRYDGAQCDRLTVTPQYTASTFSVTLSVLDTCSALSPGALAGIIVGICLLVGLLAALLVMCFKRRRAQRTARMNEELRGKEMDEMKRQMEQKE